MKASISLERYDVCEISKKKEAPATKCEQIVVKKAKKEEEEEEKKRFNNALAMATTNLTIHGNN